MANEQQDFNSDYEALPADWASRIARATSIAAICQALEIGIGQLIAWRQSNSEFNEACRRTY
jgi:hypothetical protein